MNTLAALFVLLTLSAASSPAPLRTVLPARFPARLLAPPSEPLPAPPHAPASAIESEPARTLAPADQKRKVPAGASIYVEKMNDDLDGFIRAELTKKNVPLKIVLRLEDAHLVLTGASSQRKGSWHEGWLTAEKDKATASAMIVDRASGEMLWASEAGDRSLWLGSLSRGGPRKVASRLVDSIKKALYTPPSLPPPPPLSDEERAALNAPVPAAQAAYAEAQAKPAPMTNEDVVKLVAAGLGEDLVIAKIRASETAFRLQADDLVALKAAGVSERVLAAMLEATKRRP